MRFMTDEVGKHSKGPWTPGPWKVDHDFSSDIYSITPQEELLASVYPVKRAKGSWQANAKLIAAAPELAEALRALANIIRRTEAVQSSADIDAFKRAEKLLSEVVG